MFKRVLLPVDGSELALEAVDTLAQVLEPAGEVVLVSVIDTPRQWFRHLRSAGVELEGEFEQSELADIDDEDIRRALAGQRADADLAFAAAVERLEDRGISRQTRLVRVGEPGEEIVRAAEEHQCDLIVIASRGCSGLQRHVLGSVAEYVLRQSRQVPVLLTHPTGRRAEA